MEILAPGHLTRDSWLQCSNNLVSRRFLSSLLPLFLFLSSFLSSLSLSFRPGYSVYTYEFSALYFAISECCECVVKLRGGSRNFTLVLHSPEFSGVIIIFIVICCCVYILCVCFYLKVWIVDSLPISTTDNF